MPTSTSGPGDRPGPDPAATLAGALDRFPRVALATLPTPLDAAPRLSAELGAEVLIKRDDLTGLGLGGNKVRKLEFLLGAALSEGCDTVVTFGALQSNHARQTAAACARLGLRCELVLTRAVPRDGASYLHGANVLLDELFGAHCSVVDNDDDALAAAVDGVRAGVAERGGRAHWIPPGGSDAVGTLGYVVAGLELAGQLAAVGTTPSDVVVGVSTGGTQAGLLVGLRAAGVDATVRGVAVYRDAGRTRDAVTELVAAVDGLLGTATPAGDVVITDRFRGPGYGLPTAGMADAVRTVARAEGIALDPVYSGKAADALVTWCRERELGGGPVVFVHTGGAPGLFAYPDVFPGF
jgi:D-cysteine desulfhydrase family pyridoxal phosphate-dependent enzyme